MAVLGDSAAVEFMEGSILVYAAIAAACSSPQTCEINAGKRADTLMKWVNIGVVQAAALVGIAATISRRPNAVIAGGGLTIAIMYGSYLHAKSAGLKNKGAGTEN